MCQGEVIGSEDYLQFIRLGSFKSLENIAKLVNLYNPINRLFIGYR